MSKKAWIGIVVAAIIVVVVSVIFITQNQNIRTIKLGATFPLTGEVVSDETRHETGMLRTGKENISTELSFRQALGDWLEAWKQKDLERYMDRYADYAEISRVTVVDGKESNRSKLTKEQLRERMKALFNIYDEIHVDIEEQSLKIDETQLHAEVDFVEFLHEFTAIGDQGKIIYRDYALKHLKFINDPTGGWKIYYENRTMYPRVVVASEASRPSAKADKIINEDSPLLERDNAPLVTYLGMTERQILDVFGTPTGVAEGPSLPESTRTQCPEIDKIYTYGIMYSEGYNDYGGTRFWFSKGKVVAYGRLYSGNINSDYEYYPTLKDVLPPQLLSVKPQQEHHGANVILTWDIGNVKWGATTLKAPIREYDPNKGYYWRDPTLKEYRVVYWSVMRDDLSISE